jgi:hypothetical protein
MEFVLIQTVHHDHVSRSGGHDDDIVGAAIRNTSEAFRL